MELKTKGERNEKEDNFLSCFEWSVIDFLCFSWNNLALWDCGMNKANGIDEINSIHLTPFLFFGEASQEKNES